MTTTLRQRQAAREFTRATKAANQAVLCQAKAEVALLQAQDGEAAAAQGPGAQSGTRAAGRIPQGRVKLENIPGVKFVSASGKRMRQLPTYYLKKEEQVVTGMDDEQYAAMVKKIKLEEVEKTPLPVKEEG